MPVLALFHSVDVIQLGHLRDTHGVLSGAKLTGRNRIVAA
jgi:hypothetical protein